MRPSSLALYLSLASAVACGKVQTLADAMGTGIDAVPPPDADPHGTINVTILDILGNGAPEANVPVVFINPDGTVVGNVVSDINGKASATILPGASITAVWLMGNRYTIATMVDVKPGDDLVYGFTNNDQTSAGTFTVTFPNVANATTYDVWGPCGSVVGSPGKPITVPLLKYCATDPFDVYVVANSNGTPFQFAEKRNVHLADGSATIPDSWQGMGSFDAQYTSVPADITKIDVTRVASSPNGLGASASGTPASGTLALSASPAPAAGDHAYVSSSVTSSMGQQVIRQRIAGNASHYGLDVTPNLLPWVSKPTFDVPTLTLASPTMGTQPVDMYFGDFQYSRTVGTTTTNFEWVFLAPTGGSFKLPALPASAGDVTPLATDTMRNQIALEIESSAVDGWDGARNHAFDLFREVFGAGSSPADTERASLSTTVFK